MKKSLGGLVECLDDGSFRDEKGEKKSSENLLAPCRLNVLLWNGMVSGADKSFMQLEGMQLEGVQLEGVQLEGMLFE